MGSSLAADPSQAIMANAQPHPGTWEQPQQPMPVRALPSSRSQPWGCECASQVGFGVSPGQDRELLSSLALVRAVRMTS